MVGGGAAASPRGRRSWAQYHRQAGDVAHGATACRARPRPRHRAAPAARPLAAHRLLGELDTDAGRHEDAARHLADSLALADACEAPYERALTLLAMAELRAATARARRPDALLDEVKAICAPLGAKPPLARADVVATRLPSGLTAPPGVD